MTKEKFQLREEYLLNRNNYDNWFIKIHAALKSRSILKYIEYGILKTLKEKLIEMKNDEIYD